MLDYKLRSLLFVPAHNEKFLNKAANSDADVLLLDIEDSVRPVSNKQIARDLIKSKVSNGDFRDYHVFPRINDRESGELLKDVYQLTVDGVDGFMYPKAKTGDDIYFIDKLLETIEYEKNIEIGTFKLIPLIETASAVMNAQDICKASNRIIAIAYGCEDFISDLKGIHDIDHLSLFTPRAIIAMSARACNVIPIDTVHINVHDYVDLEKNLELAKNLGYEGMLVLNPKEIPYVHQYFSPTKEEIRTAYEMVSLFEEANKNGKGVALKDGVFIGPPMVLAAKEIIRKSQIFNL
ncbi:MAG: CoA ester lyase [Marinifilaceae bacterium]|jgi:citrate lyase subunit beta/citryl-CoA lyase|nr:CoA ester lyase [Marinifilaceae bacterium]